MLHRNRTGARRMDTKAGFRAWEAMLRLATAQTRMNIAAAEVIMRRTAMMASGTMSAPEAAKMMMEKPAAFAEAAGRAAIAAARGGDATAVASAALKPIGARASANARRLRK
jgi:hypothetical protein